MTNEGVLYSLTDAAEEELSKEAILVYYHLLTAAGPLDRTQLDRQIETWMESRLGVRIDFDIDKTLQNLAELQADLPAAGGLRHTSLLPRRPDGSLQVLPLEGAKQLIDHIWDHAFEYANLPGGDESGPSELLAPG